jgi:acyl-CoA synthetase (AMP-forming)/AMP-acid ligase II
MTNFTHWLFEETKDKENIAVSFENRNMTYPYLYLQIKNTSKKIGNEIGVGKNIILISDNSPFFVISYLSIIGSGNVCIPLKYDPNINLKEIKKFTDSENIFIQEKYETILENLDFKKKFNERDFNFDTEVDYSFPDFNKDKLAVIIFTSGSTGNPKGVMLSHNNLIKNTESIIDGLGLTEKDKIMVVLPFYYCFGASLMHTHFRVGGELVLNNNFFLPQKVVQEMIDKKCTGIAGVPTTFQILLRATKMKQMQFPEMRCIQQAGGKLADSYIKELVDLFGYEKIFIMYGQTEATARLSILNPTYLKEKFGSMGKGLKGTLLKVLNSEGFEIKPGEVGEIYAQGENVMLGYYKNEEETKKKIVNGMLKTGDLARIDEDGFLFIEGRDSDFIKTRGYRVSNKSVENAIAELPEIIDVAVIGVEDDLLGEKIIAFVSMQGKLKKEDILNHCSKKLQGHELPSEIIILQELPKNSSIKTDYVKLKKDYPLYK